MTHSLWLDYDKISPGTSSLKSLTFLPTPFTTKLHKLCLKQQETLHACVSIWKNILDITHFKWKFLVDQYYPVLLSLFGLHCANRLSRRSCIAFPVGFQNFSFVLHLLLTRGGFPQNWLPRITLLLHSEQKRSKKLNLCSWNQTSSACLIASLTMSFLLLPTHSTRINLCSTWNRSSKAARQV